jgi:hypothetical protein
MVGKCPSLIAVSDADRVFDDATIKQLAGIIEDSGRRAPRVRVRDLPQFARSIRTDVCLFIEAKEARLNLPQLRREIKALYGLNKRAGTSDKAAEQLCLVVGAVVPHCVGPQTRLRTAREGY